MDSFLEIIKHTKAYYCLDCGKCTASCPVAWLNHTFSPRVVLMKAVHNEHENLVSDQNLWECLTCGLCEERCPSSIRYIDFTRDARSIATEKGNRGECSHGGAFQALMRIQTSENLKQNRLEWVTSDLKVSKTKADVVYFVGCAPYFDAFFEEIKVKTLDTAKGAIKALNAMGITPVVMPNERCCGHDLLWSGDIENFKKLAQHNLKEIEKTEAKTVVFSCPEGLRTFKIDIPRLLGKINFDVKHITELVAPKLKSHDLSLNELKGKITFQDPCRLGRHLGIYEPPREIMQNVNGWEFEDMPHSRKRSICCGVGNWMGCNTFTKQLQEQRLKEAKATGADILVTSCPKCEIHLKCAMQDQKIADEIQIEIKDLIAMVGENIR